MAVESLNINLDPTGKADLKEERLAKVVEPFEMKAISQRIKNTNLIQGASAGS